MTDSPFTIWFGKNDQDGSRCADHGNLDAQVRLCLAEGDGIVRVALCGATIFEGEAADWAEFRGQPAANWK